MNCPQCESYEIKNTDKECLICGYLIAQHQPTLRSVISPTKTKIPIHINMGITLDRSGSSNSFRDGIKQAFKLILEPIENKVARLSIYLQTHSDLDYEEKEILLTENGTAAQVISDANIKFQGGGDAEETHLDAIENLVKIVPWEFDVNSRNVIILICNDETKPLRTGKSVEDFGQELKEKGFLVFLVCEPTTALETFASASSAILIPLKNDLSPSEFQSICIKLTASIMASVSGNCKTVPLDIGKQQSRNVS